MLKKIVAILLCFSFLINNCFISLAGSLNNNNIEETQEEEEEIEELFAPAVVPVAQAFAYLLALFGVISLNEIYNNSDDSAFDDWYNQKILDFKLKCEVLGIGANAVEDWLLSLSNGVLIKSSEVWTAFKSWVADLRQSSKEPVNPGSLEDLKSGFFSANCTYDLVEIFPKLERFNDYLHYYYKSEQDCFFFSSLDKNGTLSFKIFAPSILNFYPNISANYENASGYRLEYEVYKKSNPNKLYSYGKNYFGGAVDSNSIYYYNGIQYSFFTLTSTPNTDFYKSLAPHFNFSLSSKTNIDKVFNYFLSSNDLNFVGNITDFTGVDIVSPGADVNLNWDFLNPGSAVAGVGSGSTTWQDFINSSGLTLEENGVIVGGGVIENPDVDIPETNTGLLGAILTAINGVKTAVLNIPTAISNNLIGTEPLDFSGFNVALSDYFPFCIPFDLVNCITQLNASPTPPSFTVNFAGTIMAPAGEITIDLTPMEPLAKIVRFFSFLTVTAGIIIVTRNLIRG